VQQISRRPDPTHSPVVTIGMTVYNGKAFIEDAISALTKQTYENFVLCISDDASTDGTWDILQRWAAADNRIVLHRQAANLGLLGNFRFVLDQAETEFFMWHAYDDWLAPNFLEEVVAVMKTEPNCALACSAIVKVLPDRRPVRSREFPDFEGLSRRQRILTMLGHPRSQWLYGLFRVGELRKAFGVMEEFGYPWAGDFLVLLPFIFEDRVRGTNATTFYSRITGLSARIHRPNDLASQLPFAARYFRFSAHLLRASGLSLEEKLLCAPRLALHAGRVTLKSGPLRIIVERRSHRQVARLA
jgi:glycosyltransferase involved in cell wall biosynthesis